MLVIDTGAASGRLGLLAMATAQYATQESDQEKIIQYAQQAVLLCKEYVFLEKLQYLAAGGRLSKGSAFFGDALRIKPVITPLAEGATKLGVVRSRKQQVDFAFERARNEILPDRRCFIMLEYSDNQSWLESELRGAFEKAFPAAEVFLQPLSLTSGAHMGPGTWALAFLQPPDTDCCSLKLKQ
jgi:DegV family protein with EDD domain